MMRQWIKMCAGVMAALSPLATAGAQEKITYQDHALPIFRNNCLNCHNADRKRAGLDLSSYAGAIAGSGSGKVIEPGDPDNSLLYKLVTHQEEPNMPPKGGKLPEKDLETIRKWIAAGALENSGSKAVAIKKAVDLSVMAGGADRPAGPPPMPAGVLPLQAVTHARRPGALAALAASPWAPLLAVAGQEQVLLYRSLDRELLGILPFSEGTPEVLKFSRSGKILLAGGGQGAKLGKVALFDVATGRRVAEIGDELDEVLAADISPDQSTVALGGPAKVVKIFSIADGTMLHKLTKHTDWITALAYSPDGVLLATGDRNGGLRVWEAHSGQEFYVLDAHKAAITDVAFRDDSNILASASEDGTVKLWDMLHDGKQIKSFAAAGGQGVLSIAFAHDGQIITAGRDKSVRLWKPDGSPQKNLGSMKDIALEAVVCDGGTLAVAGDYTGEVRLIDTGTGKPAGTLDVNPAPIPYRLAAARKRSAELSPAVEKAAGALAAAQQAAKQANDALAAAQQKAEQAKKLADAAAAQHAAAAAQLQSAKQEEARLQAAEVLVALNAARAELSRASADHQQKLQAQQQAEAAAKTAQDAVAAKQQFIDAAGQRAQALQDQLNKATDALAAATAASEGAKASLADRQALVQAADELAQKLKDAAAAAPDDSALASAAGKATESLETLRADVAKIEQSQSGAAAELQKATEAKSAAETALKNDQATMQAAPAELEKLKQAATAAQADAQAKKAAADAAAQALPALKQKVEAMEKQFAPLAAAATQPAK